MGPYYANRMPLYRPRRRLAFIRTGDINMPMGYRVGRVGGRRRLVETRAQKRARAKAQAARYRKRGQFSATNIGERVGTGNCKRFTSTDLDVATKATRTLYTENILAVARNNTSAADDIDQRERDVINVRGVRIHFEIANQTDAPLYFHVALLHRKDGEIAPNGTDFFRGSGSTRGLGFNSNLNSLDFHTRGINTDKYVVLKHMKMHLINPAAVDAGTGSWPGLSGRSYKSYKVWLPLRRQVRFQDASAQTPLSGNVYLVYWADGFQTPTTTQPIPDSFSFSLRSVVYYRETSS